MVQWNPELFDKHIDRDFSAFTCAEVPDPEPLSSGKHWMADYFLNATLNGRFVGRWHQLVMGLIWRSQLCLQHYSAARVETLQYVDKHDPGQPKFGVYFRALSAWEAFFLNAMLSIAYINQINGTHAFSKDDGSIDQRVYEIGTHIKHMQDRVKSGTVDHDATMAIVLTNDGVKSSSNLFVSYFEMFKLLEELAALVEETKNPRAMAEAWRTKKAEDKG